MPTKRIALFGSLINRNANPSSFSAKDQQFVNCYPEMVKNPLSGAGRVFLYKRVGFTASSAISNVTAGSQGASIWSGGTYNSPITSYTKTGTKVGFYDSNLTQVGADVTGTDCLFLGETSISNVANLVAIVVASGLRQAWFFPEGGAWTQITDGDFPPNLGTPEPLAGDPAFLDGYMFVMTTNGKIWNSDVNSLSAWTLNSFTTAQSSPDGGSGLARYKNLIVAFGTRSIEFFQNTGNSTGSVLTAVPSATIRIGAGLATIKGYRNIFPVGDTVYFIGTQVESGQYGVFRLNGYQAEKVSNSAVDKYLNSGSLGINGVILSHGQQHIIFSDYLNNTSTGFGYSIDTGSWWEYQTTASMLPVSITPKGVQSLYTTVGSAKLYSAANTTFTDDGNAYSMVVLTEPDDFGTTNRKYVERLRPAGFDVQSSTSTLTVEYSDDDQASWTTWGTIDLSDPKAIDRGLTRGGSFRRRSFRFTHSSATPVRGQAVDITYVVGTS